MPSTRQSLILLILVALATCGLAFGQDELAETPITDSDREH